MSSDIIRVVLADDHTVVRAGLKAVLGGAKDIQVVGEVANGVDAVAITKTLQPDVLVMDLTMPLMDGAEADVLAYMSFPKAHRTQIHTTNPLERLNAEIKRRTDVVGIFPNSTAVIRLVGALLLEQNDEWQLQRRYMQLEGLQSLSNNQPARLSAVVN